MCVLTDGCEYYFTENTQMLWSIFSCWTAPLTPQEPPLRLLPSAPTWPPSPVSHTSLNLTLLHLLSIYSFIKCTVHIGVFRRSQDWGGVSLVVPSYQVNFAIRVRNCEGPQAGELQSIILQTTVFPYMVCLVDTVDSANGSKLVYKI